MTDLTPQTTLDLRKTKCPLNFVKTKLALEKLLPGDLLEVWIESQGESAINIPNSIRQEGHAVLAEVPEDDGRLRILIRRR
jgi:TusA-related sulfurtransferase